MKTNKIPKLSIIIPVYNVENYFAETIESFLKDNFCDFELIAVDDCSTDKSFEILKRFAGEDERLKVYKNKNNIGKKSTVNYAFTLARGENIAIFDSDDINVFGRLKKQIEFLENNPDIDMVYGDIVVYYMKDGSKVPQEAIEFKNTDEPYERLRDFFENGKKILKLEKASQILHPVKYIPASSAIFRRSIIDSGLKMDEELRDIEDFDFWLQVIGAGYKIKRLPVDTYIYRMHSGQKSKDKTKGRIARDVIFGKLKRGEYFRS